MTVPMPPDSPSTETKTVLTPQAMVELLYRLRGGSFTRAGDAKGIEDLFSQMNFPTGAEGKTVKAEAAREGIVIVQRAVAAVRKDAHILLAQRIEPHVITNGGSILTSGSPTLTPRDVFVNKVLVEPEKPSLPAFKHIGFGLSSVEQTGGPKYFFDIYRLSLHSHGKISSLTNDTVKFVTPDEAMEALQGKPMELSLLEQLR